MTDINSLKVEEVDVEKIRHLHNQFTDFGLCEDQLSTDGKEVITFREFILRIGLIRSKSAWLPDSCDLQVQMIAVPTSGIDHPEMGPLHGQMLSHQGEHPAQHDGFQLDTPLDSEHTSSELILLPGGVGAADDTDSPVLERFSDRWDRMVSH